MNGDRIEMSNMIVLNFFLVFLLHYGKAVELVIIRTTSTDNGNKCINTQTVHETSSIVELVDS